MTTIASMGLKSREYGDKLRTLAPQDSIIGTIDANLWAGRLYQFPKIMLQLVNVPFVN